MSNLLDKEFNITEIVLCCLVTSSMTRPIHKNRSSHGLVFHLNSYVNYTFDNSETITTTNNDLIYLPKYSNYTVSTSSDALCFAINFNIDVDIVVDPHKWEIHNFLMINNIYKNAANLFLSQPRGYKYKLKSLLYDLLYIINLQSTTLNQDKYYVIIEPAIKWINENFINPNISINYLANLCNISDTYFRSIFKKIYGITPLIYINQKRIDYAKDLLDSNMFKIKDISQMCGFNDISTFSRTFKHYCGISPARYI